MTISNEACKTTVIGNGVQTVFNYTFEITTQAYADLYLTRASTGIVALIDQASWSMTGAGNPTGGTFTYPTSGGTPIATGDKLTLIRNTPEQQQTNLINQGAYYPEAVEGGLDWLQMQIQEAREMVNRGILVDVTSTTAGPPLPPPAQRASKGVGFDGSGNVTVFDYADASSSTVVPSPGSLAYTMAELFGWFVRPEWWAQNTVPGTSEMGAATQSAIDFLEATGGTILFRPQEYKISQQLVSISRALTFQGEGKASFAAVTEGTRLAFNVGGTVDWIDVQGGDNIIFRDLEIRAASGAATPTDGYAVNIRRIAAPPSISGTRCAMENVRIIGSWNAVNIYGSPAARLVDLYTEYLGVVGVRLFGDATYRTDNLYMQRVTTVPSNAAADGFLMEGQCASVFASDCYWRGGLYGVRTLKSGGYWPTFARFHRCAAEVCASHGYYLEGLTFGTVEKSYSGISDGNGIRVGPNCRGVILLDGNDVRGNGLDGIRVELSSARVIIVSNTCSDNSQITPNTYHGITLDANVSGAIIAHNICGGDIFSNPLAATDQRNGVTVSAGCTDYVVANNDLRGNTNVGLFDGGSGDVGRVYGNLGYRSATWGEAVGVTPDGSGNYVITHGCSAVPNYAVLGLRLATGTQAVRVQALSTTQLTARIYDSATGAAITAGTFNIYWEVRGPRAVG